jgi:hypothetical protein
VQPLLSEIHKHYRQSTQSNKKIIFVASEAWEMQPKTTNGIEEIADGALVLSLESQKIKGFDDYIMSLRPNTPAFRRNNWLRELWVDKFQCTWEPMGEVGGRGLGDCNNRHYIPSDYNPDNKVQFVIDAVYAIAHALDAKWV